jgi:hypothetical protein
MQPELTYPSESNPVYCHDCKEHIRENDLFGRFQGQITILYCATCFGLYHEKEMEIERRYTAEDLIR